MEYSSDLRRWRPALMVPDLALISLVAFFIVVSAFDLVQLWRVERKARLAASREEAAIKKPVYHSVNSLATVVIELCICGMMLSALSIWFSNAIQVTQDNAFLTR